MVELWKDYWKLMGDPFSEEPLRYDEEDIGTLIVETRSVEKAKRIAEDLQSMPPRVHRVYVMGQRGMGKSTILNFLAWKFFRTLPSGPVLPIYVGTLPPGKSVEEVSANFLKAIISRLFATTIQDARKVGVAGTDVETFFRQKRAKFFEVFDKIDTLVATSFLQECLSKLEALGLSRYAVLFDELDRFENQSLFLSFLKRSQGLFETLANNSVVFFMSGIPDWIQFLKQEEYSGMRGETIELAAWSAEDTFQLVSSRFKRFCTVAKNSPLTAEALQIVTKQAGGKPREILSLTKTLLALGATQRATVIDDKFCQSFLWGEDAMGQFRSELSKNESAMRGAIKLRRAFDPSRDDPRSFKVLSVIAGLGKLRADISVTTIRRDYGLDIEVRSFWNIVAVLENTKLVRRTRQQGEKDVYLVDGDVSSLLSVVKQIGEPIQFVPYAVSLIQSEVATEYEPFNARIEVTRVLNRAPERFFNPDDLSREILADPSVREVAVRSLLSGQDGDEYLYQRVRKAVVKSLEVLKAGGLVQAKQKEGVSSYRWFPKHLDWKQFEGLNVDHHTLQELEAAEMSFSKGMYDPAAILCRTVVEKAARKLFEEKKHEKSPRNWGLDELNNDLYNSKVYDRKIHAKILGLLQQTNPIVHGEVTDVGERYARIVIDLAQESIKDIFGVLSKTSGGEEMSSPTQAEDAGSQVNGQKT